MSLPGIGIRCVEADVCDRKTIFKRASSPPLASNHFYRSLDRLQRSLAKHCGGGSKVGAIPKLDSQGTPERKGGRVLNKPCSSQKQPPPSHAHGLYLAATI